MEEVIDFRKIDDELLGRVSELKSATQFFNFSEELIEKLHGRDQGIGIIFCIEFFERVSENHNFIESLNRALVNRAALNKLFLVQELEQKQKIREENKEEKKVLVAALTLSVLPLLLFLHSPNVEDITFFKKKVRRSLFKLQGNLKDFFYVSHIVEFFNELLFFESLYRTEIDHYISDFEIFTKKLISAQIISRIVLSQSIKIENLSDKTKRIAYQLEQGKKFKTYFLKKINDSIVSQNKFLEDLREKFLLVAGDPSVFDIVLDGFENNNESGAYEFIFEITKYFSVINGAWEIDIHAFIEKSVEVFQGLESVANKKLAAFRNVVIDEGEWSNKIYIVSQKLVGVAKSVNGATDRNWKVLVMKREFEIWLKEIDAILNIQDIEDDWGEIKDFVKQEDETTEWKSSFYIPVESQEGAISIEKISPFLLRGISEAMLGMINTNGGTILVGVVENVEKIKSENILKNIFRKRDVHFFDTGLEIGKIGRTLDMVKRHLQDLLTQETKKGAEFFNELWDIKPIQIKTYHKPISIHKITVKKSPTVIHSVLERDGGVWLCLRKRADGRTKMVDFREHL